MFISADKFRDMESRIKWLESQRNNDREDFYALLTGLRNLADTLGYRLVATPKVLRSASYKVEKIQPAHRDG